MKGKVLSIAGSDCSGGAGIQADLKTMTVHDVYGMTVITALTAQNTVSVQDIHEVPPAFVARQLDSVFTDIRPDAVKIGMVANAEIIETIARKLSGYTASNIVVDPVMVTTSGSRLLGDEAIATLRNELFPLASVITPNIPEGELLSGLSIDSVQDMEKAARHISRKIDASVLLKGGHRPDRADDVLFHNGRIRWYYQEHIDNPNTHGTGCTLSTAVACHLAAGLPVEQAVELAKKFLTGALEMGLSLGEGKGPLDHSYQIRK